MAYTKNDAFGELTIERATIHWGHERVGFNIVLTKYGTNVLEWGKLPKSTIPSKNASIKSCLQLNFIQKSQWAHMSISLRSRATGFQRLSFSKY